MEIVPYGVLLSYPNKTQPNYISIIDQHGKEVQQNTIHTQQHGDCYICPGGSVVSTVTSQKEASRFKSQRRSHVESKYQLCPGGFSPGSPHVPPTVQRHAWVGELLAYADLGCNWECEWLLITSMLDVGPVMT